MKISGTCTSQSVKQKLSSQATSFANIQKTPHLLRNPTVRHRFHKSPSLFATVRHTNPVHTLPAYKFKIHLNIIIPSMVSCCKCSLSLFLFSGFRTNALYVYFLCFVRATCPANLIILHSIAGILFIDEYTPWSCSLCSILKPLLVTVYITTKKVSLFNTDR